MPKVTRMEIDLSLANQIAKKCIDQAKSINVLVSVAVVDMGGNLISFDRMDDAEIAGQTLAVDKAFTSVSNRIATKDLAELVKPGGDLIGLNSGDHGRYIVFGGGVPCWDQDKVVGAIGVSGGTSVQDHEIALVGLKIFTDALKSA